ncbi:SpoIIE family protein phosphatase [Streptomyces sp. NPDC059016]|uniref:SpoIIE family protein phosphatase n=1 Tax=Streptomyces sp. NPDC059016 TaxID=3346699 RepID=UPI0036A2681C
MATGPWDRLQGRHGLPTADADGTPGLPGGQDLWDSAAGVVVLDADLRYRYANPAFCRITGESEAGVAGRLPSPAAEQCLGTSTGLPAEVLADGVPRTRVTGPGGRCHTTCLRLENEGTVTGLMCVVAESSAPRLEEELARADARLAVPLTGPPDGGGPGGTVLGLTLLARTGAAFTGHDITVARHAARRAAVGVVHARAFAAEQGKSVELQRALLTEPGKPHPNLRFATRYLPAGSSNIVGGDWFETVRLHYGRTLLVMGDVMGHGVEAAVEMNTYRAMLRDVAAADLPPHRVLRQLDIAISETMARPATCLLVRVDPARGLGSFSSAGHLPPVVFTADGHAELVDVPAGPPLGTGVGGYELVTRSLTPDDTLLLYTDGLVERRGEDIDDSLLRLVRVRLPCTATVDEMVDSVVRELDAEHAEDDVALLAARFRPRRAHPAEEQPFLGGPR